MCRDSLRRILPIGFCLVEVREGVHRLRASGGVLSEGYGHDRPDVCLGDGQTEAYLKDTNMTGLTSAWAMAKR